MTAQVNQVAHLKASAKAVANNQTDIEHAAQNLQKLYIQAVLGRRHAQAVLSQRQFSVPKMPAEIG